ncbi:MAG TPA: tetratricopeptide repeat protein [Burkholderiales bacterium]|nr:tetratricopeptide repeat protein [Burkholderiales bacterium]
MRIAPIFVFLAGVVASSAPLAQVDGLAAVRAALRSGDTVAAAAAVDRHLAQNPKDPRGRFLKGVILTEQGRSNEALDAFFGLTQDHPEFAEPYNNLAVIYAARGEYERARDMLQSAIRVKPDYATAYENLGDVYARLASQAYEKAAKLDSANRGVHVKLALSRDLMNVSPKPRAADAASAPPPRRN